MARLLQAYAVILFLVLSSVEYSEQFRATQGEILLQIQRLLEYPSVLSSWNSSTDFCNLEPSSSVTIVCYRKRLTQLHIIGNSAKILPPSFSINSFFTSLIYLPRLKVLTLSSLGIWGPIPRKVKWLPSLEIMNMSSNFLSGVLPAELSSMSKLQSLVLDDNMIGGELPGWISSLPSLTKLSLRKNLLNGTLPTAISDMGNLRIFAVSHNNLHGHVPNLDRMTQLEILDLESNGFGPDFPAIGSSLITLILANNKFRSSLPQDLSTFFQLRWLDVSNNNFVGPFPMPLLSLPALGYINISGNKFSGKLFKNQTCGYRLMNVDLSSNYLSGNLPECLSQSKGKKVAYSGNCLETQGEDQHPLSFCRNEAIAVGIMPTTTNRKKSSNAKLAVYIVVGGFAGGIIVIASLFLVYRRIKLRNGITKRTRTIAENASNVYSTKLFSEARYISQTMKMEPLGLQSYRTFTLEELEEATNNFESSGFIKEGSQNEMYKGRLKDGSLIAVKCLKLKKSHSTQFIMNYVEMISKLRHRHIISALGHCFQCYADDSIDSNLFLVFEFVPYNDLRSWVSEGRTRTGQKLNWTQRISAAIGVAKGIQFLHNGVVPGIFSNNLKITDVLLDQNISAKISCFNLPLLTESTSKLQNGREAVTGVPKGGSNARSIQDEKSDIYDFGVILLEIIVGKALKSENDIKHLREQLQSSLAGSENTRKLIADPVLKKSYSDQSLKTMMEICAKCLLDDEAARPSVEDVLWNLQFAVQVQDAWHGETSSVPSPIASP